MCSTGHVHAHPAAHSLAQVLACTFHNLAWHLLMLAHQMPQKWVEAARLGLQVVQRAAGLSCSRPPPNHSAA